MNLSIKEQIWFIFDSSKQPTCVSWIVFVHACCSSFTHTRPIQSFLCKWKDALQRVMNVRIGTTSCRYLMHITEKVIYLHSSIKVPPICSYADLLKAFVASWDLRCVVQHTPTMPNLNHIGLAGLVWAHDPSVDFFPPCPYPQTPHPWNYFACYSMSAGQGQGPLDDCSQLCIWGTSWLCPLLFLFFFYWLNINTIKYTFTNRKTEAQCLFLFVLFLPLNPCSPPQPQGAPCSVGYQNSRIKIWIYHYIVRLL